MFLGIQPNDLNIWKVNHLAPIGLELVRQEHLEVFQESDSF